MPTTVDGKEVIAAHEKPATPDEEVTSTTEETPAEETPKQTPETNWEERYRNLEKKHGEHSNELGTLRKENRKLSEQIAAMQKPAETAPGPMTPDQKLLQIKDKVRDGELSWEDGLVEASSLAAQIGATKAQQQFQQELGNRDAKQNAQRFLEKNPDFLDLQASGKLDEMMTREPGIIQDEVAAYYAYKALNGEEVGYNRAKEELAKLAESELKTKTVLKKPGSSIRQTNTKPLKSPHEIKSSMLEALRKREEE